jgi:ABC-type lipoprotein release transport system permease subunit
MVQPPPAVDNRPVDQALETERQTNTIIVVLIIVLAVVIIAVIAASASRRPAVSV